MSEDSFLYFKQLVQEKESSSVQHSVESHNSTEKVLMSAYGYIASAVILFLIGICGFCFNFIVIIVMLREKSLRTPFNTILLNLAFSDVCVSILGNPVTFTAAVYRKWIFGRTVCVLYGFFMALIGITSITTITVLSFERYLSISNPFHPRRFSSEHSKLVVFGIWTYSFLLTFPPLIGWGEYVNEPANISCSVNWEDQNFKTTMYIIYLFILGLALPLCIICFSYAKIIHILTQKKIPSKRASRREVKVAIMLAVMVTVFLIAWTPYAVLALLVAFVDPNIVTPAVSVIPALLAKSSICYNPIIYAGMNTQIRMAGCKMFGVKKERARISIEEDVEDNLEVITRHSEVQTENVAKSEEVNFKCVEKVKNENETAA